jgi:hypothetical protein
VRYLHLPTVFTSEIIHCLLGEIGLQEEIAIGDEEVGVGLLHKTLQGFPIVFGDLAPIAICVKHLGEEDLKC